MSTGRGNRLAGLIAAAGLVVAGVGAAYVLQSPGASTPLTPGPSDAGDAATATPPTQKPKPAPWEAGAPRRLVVPSMGIDAPVMPIATRGDTLVQPSDPQQLGWWADGAKPGAKRGSALVTGHTVHTGGGALDDLEEVEVGSRMVVRTDQGKVVYEVERVKVFGKGTIADEAERLFSQEVPGRLVVITCEDWDGTRYLSNVVVTATPISG